MKKYIITEEEREEVLDLIKNRSTLSARNTLNQLEELKEEKKEIKKDGEKEKKDL